MDNAPIDPFLAFERPELVVLELLQHAMAGARQALAGPHPEILARGDLGNLADECHIAVLIAQQLDDLHRLIAKYRAALETYVLGSDDDDIETPDDIPW